MSRRRTPSRHSSTDVAGRDVRVGDWVRVISVPDSISRMPRATKQAFSRAVGKTFQIEAFDELGCAELDLSGKVGLDTIWIEPFCVQRLRRPKKQSLRFRKTLAIRRKLDRPRWSLRYVAKYSPKDNPDRLVEQLQPFSLGHGWYVLKYRTEIHGTFYGRDKTLGSRRRLEQLRKELRKNDLFLSLRLGSIRLST
jgi:hypothetical protein